MKLASVVLIVVLGVGAVATIVAADPAVPGSKSGSRQPKAVSTASSKVAPKAPAISKPDTNAPIIVHLERRGQTITICSGLSGPIYTVTGKGGKVLWAGLTESELKAKAPDIHDFVKTAYAGRDATGARVLDARVIEPAPPR